MPGEATPHGLLAAEAAASGDLLEGLDGVGEQRTRLFDTQPFDGAGRRHAGRLPVAALKAAFAHAGPRSKGGDRQVGCKVFPHPAMQGFEAGGAMLERQGSAVLRLSARTLEEDHQLARHRQRHGAAKVVFDQSESEVDAGGHAGRGP